jgi:hypothetical protein
LRGLNLFICCRPGENGGLEVTVEAQSRRLLAFVESSADGFEILPDGKIIPLYRDTAED